MKKVKRIPKVHCVKEPYKVILSMAGNDYHGVGETLLEALDDLKLEWHLIKAKGLLNITHGDKKLEKLFYLKPLKRIFANKITRQFWAKNLDKLMETASMSG